MYLNERERDAICRKYYEPMGEPMKRFVDKILKRKREVNDYEKDDYYSLAWYTLNQCLNTYNGIGTFDGFFAMCLERKIYSQFSHCDCNKRNVKNEEGINLQTLSLDCEYDGERLEDLIPSNEDVLTVVIKRNENLSDKMRSYLRRLSSRQKEILFYLADGYSCHEIKDMLRLTGGDFADAMRGIRSYENTTILLL